MMSLKIVIINFVLVALGLIGVGGCVQQAGAQSERRAMLEARGFARLRGGRDRIGSLGERRLQGRRSERDRGAEELHIAGLHVSVWRPAHAHTGRAPLVIFSHGFHGMSTQSTFLMKALADHGYLVIAPDHRDAWRLPPAPGFSWRPEAAFVKPEAWSDATYKDRAGDITSLLHAMKRDPAWSGVIDWSKIALAGHSLGGYTVLGLAGGWPKWKLPQVKAVLALSPFCTPFILKKSLGSLHVPVMYQGGTLDLGITPFVKSQGGAYDQTSAPAYFVEFDRAGHFAWTDLNPTYQSSIIYYSIAFLNKYLKRDHTANPTRRRPDVADLRSK